MQKCEGQTRPWTVQRNSVSAPVYFPDREGWAISHLFCERGRTDRFRQVRHRANLDTECFSNSCTRRKTWVPRRRSRPTASRECTEDSRRPSDKCRETGMVCEPSRTACTLRTWSRPDRTRRRRSPLCLTAVRDLRGRRISTGRNFRVTTNRIAACLPPRFKTFTVFRFPFTRNDRKNCNAIRHRH